MKSAFKLLLLAGLVAVSSCKKSDDPDPVVVPADKGTLFVHLHSYLENNEVAVYGATYTTDAGRKISLDLSQTYLSKFQLVKADGSIYEVKDKKVLQELAIETYSLGEVPVGDYKSIRFHLGFDATDNQAAPSSDPALLDRPEMWFGGAPQPDGYVFMHVKGKVDPTPDFTGAMQPFEYKLGTAASYIEIKMPEQPYAVVKNQASYVHLLVDYAQLFNNLPWHSADDLSVLTAADNAKTPATWIMLNVPSMFRYEE